MTRHLLWKLTRQSMAGHRQTLLPFILSSGILVALFYVVVSLINNDYVQQRHEILQIVMTMAAIISALFTVIFMVYAYRFISKQRAKEMGLFSVLGLEKKHLRQMNFMELLVEAILVFIIGIIGGYLFGHLSFVLVNQLMQNTGFNPQDYPFSWQALGASLILLIFVFVLLHLLTIRTINKADPIQLINESRSKDQAPKFNLLYLILGFALVGAGYYLAWSAEGIITAINVIFTAALLVIVGSYFLFGSLSMAVLKFLKSRPKFFYQPQNFLSVSGMLYRMKANATALTSLSILCAGVMMILSMTITAYRGLEDQTESIFPANYYIQYVRQTDFHDDEYQAATQQALDRINQYAEIENVRNHRILNLSLAVRLQELQPLQARDQSEDDILPAMAGLQTQADYNESYQEGLQLKDNQIGLLSNKSAYNDWSTVTFMAEDFEVVPLKSDYFDSRYAIDYFQLVVPDSMNYEEIYRFYPSLYENEPLPIEVSSEHGRFVDVKGDSSPVEDHIDEIREGIPGVVINTHQEARQMVYELNGGALFLGIIVTAILLVGVFLIIFFKQLSEGYQDQRNYSILKQVGIPQSLIKKTIRQQIIWVFLLPLLVAILHLFGASKIIFNALGLINVRSESLYLTSLAITLLIFTLAYFVMYWLTSRTYYQMVNQKQVEK